MIIFLVWFFINNDILILSTVFSFVWLINILFLYSHLLLIKHLISDEENYNFFYFNICLFPCKGFGTIGKKLGEAWQALPEKEKMVCSVILYSLILVDILHWYKDLVNSLCFFFHYFIWLKVVHIYYATCSTIACFQWNFIVNMIIWNKGFLFSNFFFDFH